MKLVILTLFTTVSLSVASAQAEVDANYYKLGKVHVQEIDSRPLDQRTFAAPAIGTAACKSNSRMLFRAQKENNTEWMSSQDVLNPLAPVENALDTADHALDTLDRVINVGKLVWNLVEKGRAVVNLQTDVATALPDGARCWQDLETWQAPVAKTYHVVIENLYGMDVISFKYRLVYIYGGSVKGKGKYIGYAALEPSDVNVAWGFKLNAKASVQAIYNMGTKKDPVAAINLMMSYQVESPFDKAQSNHLYFVSGKGDLKELQ